jgi:putative ABC transport system substrate-binding protein
MKRRKFILGLSSLAAVCPVRSRAEQPNAIVGFLGGASAALFEEPLRAFHRGLAEGPGDSPSMTVEERWAEGQNDRLSDLAADHVSRKVDVIVTVTTPGALAAKAATTQIPIVFAIGSDPSRTVSYRA